MIFFVTNAFIYFVPEADLSYCVCYIYSLLILASTILFVRTYESFNVH